MHRIATSNAMKRVVFLLLVFVLRIGFAADCQKTGSSCVDTTASKSVSGVTVTLAEVGGCWEYEDTYTCLKPNAVNYCQPLVNSQPQCWQTTTQCSQSDTLFNTGCMTYTKTWRCGDPNTPTPANTIRLDNTYSLVSSAYDSSPCQSLDTSPNCQIAQSTCTSTTPPTLPPGVTPAQVAPDGCYQKQNTYACYSISTANTSGCIRSRSDCIDSTPSKVINGISVSVSSVGGCWQYRDSCLSASSLNYCAPFESLPQCSNTSLTCIQQDSTFNSGCMKYTATWRCGDPLASTPSNTIRLDDTYTLVSSNYDPAPCQSLETNANCQIAQTTCTSTTPPSLPPGISPSQVAPDGCYQRQNSYACLTGRSDTSECAGYAANPACSLESSTCTDGQQINSQCLMEARTYRCMSRSPQTSTITDCSGQQFCQNGNCFDRGYAPDTDFARSMALMEAAREAGVYGAETEIFKGFDSRCRIKLFGLANCCKKSSGGAGFSNFNLLGSALSVGGQALDVGSSYVYDALYDAPTLQQGLGAALGVLGGDGLFNPSFSFYGFSFSFLPSQGFVFTGFDPYSLAFQIGVMILQDLLSCEQSEQILAMRRDQNLCHEIGTYCSSELKLLFTKICIEHTKSYCCFNSRLARILNEQGRGQIGKSWGGAQSPNCTGFTQAEFAAIDFSSVDLSEFTAEIMANIRMPNIGSTSQQVQTSVQQKVQNYYQR